MNALASSLALAISLLLTGVAEAQTSDLHALLPSLKAGGQE